MNSEFNFNSYNKIKRASNEEVAELWTKYFNDHDNKALRDELSIQNKKVVGWDADFDPFYGAPVILIVLANKAVPTYIYDGSLVMGNLMNAAESLGVASIWIHRAKEEFESEFGKNILKKLGIEGDYEGIGHCAIGYAAEPAKEPAPRKDNYIYYI